MKGTSSNDQHQIYKLLKLWKERKYDFEREEAIVASPTGKFEIKKLIEECKQKISELEERLKNNDFSGDWRRDYGFPEDICKNQEGLLDYLEIVIPRLRENFGFLDIKNRVQCEPIDFKFLARKQNFDISVKWGVHYQGEAFYMFAEFYQITFDSLMEFGNSCLKYALKTANTNNNFLVPLYNLKFPNNFCFAVALVDSLSQEEGKKILCENPLRDTIYPFWNPVIVVYELNTQKLFYYRDSNDWVDKLTGEIAWNAIRDIIQKTLSPQLSSD